MKIEAGKEYRSRRGERVFVTAVDNTGPWPVHFVVMDGRYKGVGHHDGCRLRIDGRSTEPKDGMFTDHWNDLVEEWTGGGDRIRFEVKLSQSRASSRQREMRAAALNQALRQ